MCGVASARVCPSALCERVYREGGGVHCEKVGGIILARDAPSARESRTSATLLWKLSRSRMTWSRGVSGYTS